MNLSLAILWIVVGLASFLRVFPWWWEPYPPEGKPQPVPWIPLLTAVVGGFVGGWAFTSVWAIHEPVTVVEAAATAVGSLLGARLLVNIYGLMRRPSSTRAR